MTEACDGVPRQVDRVTNHEPLGVACADIDGRTVTVALVLPNRQLVAPPKRAQPEGYVCIPIHFGSGLSNDCVMEGETLRVQHSSFDEVGVSWAALVVGDDVSSVVAITEMGTVVTTVPHDGIAFLWWPSEAGDLFRAAAESPDGFTSMFPDPEHD